jgi:peroxiredoxin
VVQLLPFKPEFEALHTRVTVISFGTPALAQNWIEQTRSSFQFLIDPEKKAYRAYGLESSLLRSWSPKIWFAYTRLMLQGWKWRGIQGDSRQLGGDFIVDQQGIIRMAYRSHDPTERPKIEEIIQVLDEIKYEG